jgi:hypothetical protein
LSRERCVNDLSGPSDWSGPSDCGWWLLRIVGLNYIAFAFAVDFVRLPASASAKYLMGYLPFVLLSVAGPMLRLAAFGQRVITSAGKLRHSGH